MTSQPPRRAAKKSGSNLTLSVILGIVLVPVAAVAATLLSGDDVTQAEATETTVTTSQPAPSVAEIAYANVEATAEDLAYACGEGGLWLVDAENSGAITPLQQAALDALRGICEGQGTPLPGKAAPPPITQTRTVTVTVPPPPLPPATTDDVFVEADGSVSESEVSEGDDQSSGETEGTVQTTATAAEMGSYEKYVSVYNQALAEIERAESEGGSLEEVSEARKKLEEAQRAAEAGKYADATTQAYEAIGKAREATGEREDD